MIKINYRMISLIQIFIKIQNYNNKFNKMD